MSSNYRLSSLIWTCLHPNQKNVMNEKSNYSTFPCAPVPAGNIVANPVYINQAIECWLWHRYVSHIKFLICPTVVVWHGLPVRIFCSRIFALPTPIYLLIYYLNLSIKWMIWFTGSDSSLDIVLRFYSNKCHIVDVLSSY